MSDRGNVIWSIGALLLTALLLLIPEARASQHLIPLALLSYSGSAIEEVPRGGPQE